MEFGGMATLRIFPAMSRFADVLNDPLKLTAIFFIFNLSLLIIKL